MSSIYDGMVTGMHNSMEHGDRVQAAQVRKGKRPLKMPKNYDFSVRNVNWGSYKKDFLLRTDAVWERNKLMDVFYINYKADIMFDPVNSRYMIPNIRMMPLPTNEPEHLEDWTPFMGYTDNDGCIWQFKVGPMVQSPNNLSKFVADKEGDSWYLCFMSFQKFMLCNERSPVKLDECNLFNQGFWEYPCYDEVENMLEACGPDLFEPMFESYRVRLMSGTLKPPSYTRLQTHVDAYGTTSDRKVMHF